MAKKLIIGIDASRSNVKQKTGTEYYSFEIIKNLVKFKNVNFILYSKTPIQYLKKTSNFQNKVMPFFKLWSQIRLSFEMIKNPPDVLFEPAHTIPIIHPKNTVVTLHDVGFRYFPELYTPLERFYHNWCMAYSVKHAKKIIAISFATRRDLIKIYGADEKKITVIYHGFEKEKYFPLKDGEVPPEWLKKFLPYIYFIGRIEAKKNVKNLIRAFAELKKDKSIKHKLLLAGRPGYLYEEIKDEINNLNKAIQEDIIELGYVPDEKASNLMRFADIFAFPSKFEGFGLPLVEAMASGVPIVASNTTSIPEVVDKSALLCSPDDYVQMSNNFARIINDNKLRSQLVKKGLERAKIFSWHNAAKRTLEVILDASN